MRYSTVPAIDFDTTVARNRDRLMAMPTKLQPTRVWNPERLEFDPLKNIRVTTR